MLFDASKNSYSFSPVAVVHSCFKEKFAVPRQSGLSPHAQGRVELIAPYNTADFVEGLETCSHIWLQFVFHQHINTPARAKVRPPRLGGNKKLGVFATRAPVRPNAIGLSVVRLLNIDVNSGGVSLVVGGLDLVDGTPVLDIKPYVPYADKLDCAHNHFAEEPPTLMPVRFKANLADQLTETPAVLALIEEVLALDPRPQYQGFDSERIYGAQIGDYDVRWHYCQKQESESEMDWQIEVVELIKR